MLVKYRLKVVLQHRSLLRLTFGGSEVIVHAAEVEPHFQTLHNCADYAVSELEKLAARLREVSDAVEEYERNGGFNSGSEIAPEVCAFVIEHLRLTRRYWHSHGFSTDPHQQRTPKMQDLLWRVVFARRARLQSHVREAKTKMCPVAYPIIRRSRSEESPTLSSRWLFEPLVRVLCHYKWLKPIRM